MLGAVPRRTALQVVLEHYFLSCWILQYDVWDLGGAETRAIKPALDYKITMLPSVYGNS